MNLHHQKIGDIASAIKDYMNADAADKNVSCQRFA